mmetsp:Transcript_33682/g.108809  ORF Transcript_33682/g.108809 Transcript_33682/m.108809 type:complete len:204 (+) Transcript_33682:972-1583(+)
MPWSMPEASEIADDRTSLPAILRNSAWTWATVRPRVSGTKRKVKTSQPASTAANGKKTYGPSARCIGGKPRPTAALHSQLSVAAKPMAVARGPSGKISAPICHGIGPGPSSNVATNRSTKPIAAVSSMERFSWTCGDSSAIRTADKARAEMSMPRMPSRRSRRRPARSIIGTVATMAMALTPDASSVPTTGLDSPADWKKEVE